MELTSKVAPASSGSFRRIWIHLVVHDFYYLKIAPIEQKNEDRWSNVDAKERKKVTFS